MRHEPILSQGSYRLYECCTIVILIHFGISMQFLDQFCTELTHHSATHLECCTSQIGSLEASQRLLKRHMEV